MRTSLSEIQPTRRTAVTIGTFDGLHRGHQALIEHTKRYASHEGLQTLVFAFSQPPQNYFGAQKPLLIPLEKKLALLEKEFDYVLSVDFPDVSWMEASLFVEDVLVKKLKTKILIVGTDWRFGKERKGDLTLLKKQGEAGDFRVETVAPVRHQERVISSTAIRELILSGQVNLAKDFLGYIPSLSGRVIHGDGRGRLLGYPTANLAVAAELARPAEGVYAARARYRQYCKDAILYIGKRPTFDGKIQTVEVHLFETAENLYGSEMEVELLQHIRGDLQFADSNSLQRQIELDVSEVRTILRQKSA
jgi:riboflavin kinase/FMN adenylyltransferase